jgi:hypothetical protein
MARSGLPPLAPSAGKQTPIVVRLDSSLVANLRAAAREKGWSLSEEIEDRLRATLAEDGLVGSTQDRDRDAEPGH